MTTYLLDVNALLALADPAHTHHEAAHLWFADIGRRAWATCPITENGFVRIASNPAYPNRPGDASLVRSILQQFCADSGHEFWADEVSIRSLLQPGIVITHRHITDVYLLGLAASKGGKLASFDQSIPLFAVPNGIDALELLLP